MPPLPGRKNLSTKNVKIKNVGSVRKSKITQTCGVGSLVEFPAFSGIMAGLDKWKKNIPDEMILYEKTLEDILGKKYFVQLAQPKDIGYGETYKIPVIRFPKVYFCPKCHQLDKIQNITKDFQHDTDSIRAMKCNSCGYKELIPSRFVIVCRAGHIDDFPYEWWAHRNKILCDNPNLSLEYIGKTGGLESIIVKCKNCGAFNSMANCLSEDMFMGFKCSGRRPWLEDYERNCDLGVRALMRGSNNIYYPEIVSALTIPPWSNDAQQLINREYKDIKYDYDDKEDSVFLLKKRFQRSGWADLLRCSFEDFYEQVKIRFGEHQKVSSIDEVRRNEYKAFTGNDKDEPYFKTETIDVADKLQPYISLVKKVKRLRRIDVLTGFRRISAYTEEGSMKAPLSKYHDKEWLPANELLGEGIFIELNKEAVKEWAKKVKKHYEPMKQRYENIDYYKNNMPFYPEYVLLHSFSHLLIRELSITCGYDASSLAEELYIHNEDGELSVGVLIYTATSSSDGSLGGLVREAGKENFEEIVENMVEHARWCSNDPICIESTNQGVKSLNYAACHACMLISETSCRNNNVLLDRCAIVGNSDEGEIEGYFKGL